MVACACPAVAAAQDVPSASSAPQQAEAPSPWLLVPTVSSNPKPGTSAGGLGGYLHKFDPESRGAQGDAANYQVLGESSDDQFVLKTLGVKGFASAAMGAVVLRDSRDSDDMPTHGWYLNLNNLAYREAFGGSSSFDSYRADLRTFWPHGEGHVLAIRQNNWFTTSAPVIAQATVVLRAATSRGSTWHRTCRRSKSRNASRSTLAGV